MIVYIRDFEPGVAGGEAPAVTVRTLVTTRDGPGGGQGMCSGMFVLAFN